MWRWVRGPLAQSAASLTAVDPGVASLILAQPYTFMEIDIIAMVILLPLIEEGLLSVTTGNRLVKLAKKRSVVRKLTVLT